MTREKAIEVLENGAWWDLLIPITTIEGRKSDIDLTETEKEEIASQNHTCDGREYEVLLL